MENEKAADVEGSIDRGRVVSFSDAVFAFAATLLVIKIELPQLDSSVEVASQLPTVLTSLWPTYFANIISFLVIAYYWLNHHAVFNLIKRYNNIIVWLNIFFLISVSFLPFPVDLFGDFNKVPVVIMFYSASVALVGFLLCLVWAYATYKKRFIDKDMPSKKIRYYYWRLLLAPLVFTLSIPLASFDITLAQFSWIFVIIGAFIINKFFGYTEASYIEKASV